MFRRSVVGSGFGGDFCHGNPGEVVTEYLDDLVRDIGRSEESKCKVESLAYALLLGIEIVDAVDEGVGPVAVYGRCSTEDNQDPKTSRGWQFGNARKFIEPAGGTVAAEFSDIGQSRSVPWERREESSRLLAALKDPNRGWDAVVVGRGRGAGSVTSSR
jgi:hypothetical protein